MTLDEFAIEYSGLTESARKEKLQRFFDYLLRDLDQNEGFIDELLSMAAGYEADDYFGTEGMKL